MGILDAPALTPRQRREPKRRRSYPLRLGRPVAGGPTTTLTKGSGVSAATVASGGTGYAVNDTITLTGGTFGTPALLKVTTVSSGAVTAAAIIRAGTYSANPANPVAQGSTTGSGTGATFTVTMNAGSMSSVISPTATGPGTAGVFRFLGNGPTNFGGYYGMSTGGGTACIFEWTTDAPAFDVKTNGSNVKFSLYANGVRVTDAAVTTDSSGAPYVYSVDWGGVAIPRTYRLFGVNMAFGGVNLPSPYSVWYPADERRPLAWSLGDSYTFGTGATSVSHAAINTMADLLNIDLLPDGIGGASWGPASTGGDPVTRVNTKLGALTETPDYVFLDLGYNNAGGDMAVLSSDFDATVAAVRTVAPAAKIIVFGPATPLGATANLTTVKTTISGRCAALGLPFVDVENWVNSTNKSIYTDADNTHPNQAGHDYIAARRAQVVSPLL